MGKLLCVGDALHASSTRPLAPGFELRSAPTAAACLTALDEERFDLVLIAFTLPDSSGCALRDHLRSRSELAATPILVTAENDPAPSTDASPTPRTALRELQRMLETAEAIAHLGSWRSSAGGEWPFVWSAENYRIHGVAEGVVITPELFMSHVHPDDRARFTAMLSAPRVEGTIHEMAYRIVRPDGDVRCLHVLSRITYDSAGALLWVDGTTQDVTDRRAAELARDAAHADVAASRDRIADILESITDGFFTVDRQQRLGYFNPAMVELTGRRADEVQGRELFHELPLLARDPIVRATLAHPPGTCEIHDEASGRWFNLRAFPTKEGVAGYLRDETARRQAEYERDRFFELSHDLLGIVAFDGQLRRTSPSWSRATGFTAEELQRMPIADRIHADDLAVTRGAMERLRGDEPVVSYENRIRCKNGGYRSIEWTAVAAADEQRAYSVGRDVTAHKSLESQLRQAQKMEAIGQLAGGIAHDFNNMLSVILGVGQILRQEINEGDPLRADVNEIIAAAERAATLTRQLLAFSRKQVLKPRATDLSTLLREMEGMLRRLIGEDVELTMILAPQAGPVLADPGQLEQVILNLAVNARDAMPGGGRLTIETRTVQVSREYAEAHLGLQPGAYALLLVSDNGEGMTAAVRERVFEPFFTTKEPGRGTGLGLSTVHGIVAQSEGHVWIYSEPGLGTTFKIHLPLREGATAQAPTPPTIFGGGKGERVLLVEDEPLVRQFTRRALTRAGYRVIEAANGGEALLIVESHEGPIDLLLTDVVMPRMSGPALAERLQRLRPGLRTLFMSGYSQAALGEGKSVPGDSDIDLVEKPITLEALARKVREVLDR
jgi:two-component system, cell cycle sensor histidine kinase and response regulator CckA